MHVYEALSHVSWIIFNVFMDFKRLKNEELLLIGQPSASEFLQELTDLVECHFVFLINDDFIE